VRVVGGCFGRRVLTRLARAVTGAVCAARLHPQSIRVRAVCRTGRPTCRTGCATCRTGWAARRRRARR